MVLTAMTRRVTMQFLVLLLSATLATVAYGAANPGGHHFGHAYHDGPHCHDQKDHEYHKRSANPGDHGHSSGPYCEDKKEKQCHKHPEGKHSQDPQADLQENCGHHLY